ncbi:MAG: NusG domain II-containing protein [Clostridiales bacterium]|jgi:hypothetical protein|nr:NusG domain II-containing protein [Clostridiales bacterium]
MERHWFKKNDLFIIGGILLAAAVLYICRSYLAGSGGEVFGEIYVKGRFAMRVSLAEDAEFSLPGRENVGFTVKNGAIAFTRSDCPDQTCVRSGFLHQPGQVAACLPNGLSIKIAASRPDLDAPDAVTR